MFLDPSSPIGDNLMYPFFYLGQRLKKLGHNIRTLDTDNIGKFDAIVFIEFPGFENTYFKKLVKNNFKNLYLILLESPIVKPDNYILENHRYFKKIFTWSDPLIDNKRYFKIQYSHNIPDEFDFGLEKNPSAGSGQVKKLCAIISSNKLTLHPNELYSERIKAIRWFEKNHPEDFDLYGKGWDRHHFDGELLGFKLARFNRLTFLAKLLKPHYPSWQGSVASKRETYEKYQFSICYESTKDISGYITEKIFDCFLASCVPIYLGAQNITDHIPANTFIDKRKFSTYEALYSHIKHMPDQQYREYLKAIETFLKSEKSYPFSAEYFANTIIPWITKCP